jgi:hypothetical protein
MTTQIPVLADRDRRLVCLWLAGVPLHAMKEDLGVKSHSWLLRRGEQLGLPPKRSHSGANLFPCIVAWAKAGWTPLEIARGIGCANPGLVASIGVRPLSRRHCEAQDETREEFRARLLTHIEGIEADRKRRKKRWIAARPLLECVG